MSVASSTCLLRGLPCPWPAAVSTRSRIGASDAVAAWSLAAIAAAAVVEQRGRRIAMLDEPFCSRDEIVEDVLLVAQHPGLVPRFTLFAAAAQVGEGIHTPGIQPQRQRGNEFGGSADVAPT